MPLRYEEFQLPTEGQILSDVLTKQGRLSNYTPDLLNGQPISNYLTKGVLEEKIKNTPRKDFLEYFTIDIREHTGYTDPDVTRTGILATGYISADGLNGHYDDVSGVEWRYRYVGQDWIYEKYPWIQTYITVPLNKPGATVEVQCRVQFGTHQSAWSDTFTYTLSMTNEVLPIPRLWNSEITVDGNFIIDVENKDYYKTIITRSYVSLYTLDGRFMYTRSTAIGFDQCYLPPNVPAGEYYALTRYRTDGARNYSPFGLDKVYIKERGRKCVIVDMKNTNKWAQPPYDMLDVRSPSICAYGEDGDLAVGFNGGLNAVNNTTFPNDYGFTHVTILNKDNEVAEIIPFDVKWPSDIDPASGPPNYTINRTPILLGLTYEGGALYALCMDLTNAPVSGSIYTTVIYRYKAVKDTTYETHWELFKVVNSPAVGDSFKGYTICHSFVGLGNGYIACNLGSFTGRTNWLYVINTNTGNIRATVNRNTNGDLLATDYRGTLYILDIIGNKMYKSTDGGVTITQVTYTSGTPIPVIGNTYNTYGWTPIEVSSCISVASSQDGRIIITHPREVLDRIPQIRGFNIHRGFWQYYYDAAHYYTNQTNINLTTPSQNHNNLRGGDSKYQYKINTAVTNGSRLYLIGGTGFVKTVTWTDGGNQNKHFPVLRQYNV